MRRSVVCALSFIGAALLIHCTGGETATPTNTQDAEAGNPVGTTDADVVEDASATGESPEIAPLTADDLTHTWVKLAIPHAVGGLFVVRGRAIGHNFVALSREDEAGGPKEPRNFFHSIYRSDDGVTWHRVALPTELAKMLERSDVQGLTDLAYGAGRYVAAAGETLWTSIDLLTWTQAKVSSASAPDAALAGVAIQQVKRVNGHFFAFARDATYISEGGLTWTRSKTTIPILQGKAISFGNSIYMLIGAISIHTSVDGLTWQDHTPECNVPGASCISPPSGTPIKGPYYNGVFLDDRFYVDHMTATDGATWQSNNGLPPANDAVGGYLFNTTGDEVEHVPNAPDTLRAFRPNEAVKTITLDVQPFTKLEHALGNDAETITSTLPTGETCSSNRCLVIESGLYLIR